jgi:hypothetical protein
MGERRYCVPQCQIGCVLQRLAVACCQASHRALVENYVVINLTQYPVKGIRVLAFFSPLVHPERGGNADEDGGDLEQQ